MIYSEKYEEMTRPRKKKTHGIIQQKNSVYCFFFFAFFYVDLYHYALSLPFEHDIFDCIYLCKALIKFMSMNMRLHASGQLWDNYEREN